VHIYSTQPIVFTSAMVCENKSHFGPELNEIALDVIDLKARKKKKKCLKHGTKSVTNSRL